MKVLLTDEKRFLLRAEIKITLFILPAIVA